MAVQGNTAANPTISLSQKLGRMISGGLQEYNSWKSMILEIEKAPPEDINTISLAYDTFLSKFPLCHWHLEKYAYQKAKFCDSREAVNVYERAAEVAMFSVGFWVDYFTFAAASFGSPVDIRRLFERAISFVGRDYFCHILWDKYMKYEFNQEGWSFLAQSYIWALRFPTKKLRFYFDNFKQFVANLEEEIEYEKNDSIKEQLSIPFIATKLSKDEISLVIKDMLNSSNGPLKSKALARYRSIGEEFYLEACQLDSKIKRFETKIKRRYFDVTPLDDDQLNNWHLYLDFIEKQDNMDWTMKLYERCLIPCANYPEFWMRYVEFLESKGGRELAISALGRATQIFLKSIPEIHLFDARFKEHIGDANGARAALALCDPKTDSSFIESIDAQANLERRLGNFVAASATYEKALKEAWEKQKLHVLPNLYSHFSRLRFLITGSAAASRDVLIEGIRQLPRCRFLLEELIKFAMIQEGASHVNVIDSIISDAISPGLDEYECLDSKDREYISCLFLEFVNLCGTMLDIRKAWNRHFILFPQSLRMKTAFKHSGSANRPIGLAGDKKDNCSDQHHRQVQASELPANIEVQPDRIVRELSLPKDHINNFEENVATREILSNGDGTQDREPAHEISDGHGPMVVSVESSEQAKENALTLCDSDKDLLHQSRGEEPGPMDISDELGMQSIEDASEPPKSAHEVGRSTDTQVQRELDCKFNQLLHSVSFNHDSVKSQEKESEEPIPMSGNEYETKRNLSVRSVVSPRAHTESESDGSASYQHTDTEEPSSTRADSIERGRMVLASGHLTSGFQDHVQDRELKLQQSFYVDHQADNALNSKLTNQGSSLQYPARGRHSQWELGATREDKATDREQRVMKQGNSQQHPARQQCSQSELLAVQDDGVTDLDQRMAASTPPTSINTSGGTLPVSSQPVSYAQQNMPTASDTTQQQWQTQQSIAMNQMMVQYHYQQQQFLQQQYQHMQHPYYQMQQQYMNQQPYQVDQHQHNQQQGYEQQVNDKQYQPSQNIGPQAHQLAYQQHASQEQQQLLWQQYQQYQGYQLMQQQQQQHHLQSHSQQQFTQNMSQHQQGCRRGTGDYDAGSASGSPSQQA